MYLTFLIACMWFINVGDSNDVDSIDVPLLELIIQQCGAHHLAALLC